MVASSEGGMDIEEVAETNPDAIVTEAMILKQVYNRSKRNVLQKH